MRIPVIQGVIERRILANFRVDAVVMARNLPSPFRPKLESGKAIAGICLIRLARVRPRFFPLPWGIRSENAAHRIAVEWDEGGEQREGVYIPRRDTDSRLNAFAGGTLFPGVHHHARFDVTESETAYLVRMESKDGERVTVEARPRADWSEGSIFPSVEAASRFFEDGSLGYSATGRSGRYDGLELRCKNWTVTPLEVEHFESTYFGNPEHFPPGSVEPDCALLMRDIDHEWHGRGDLCA